MRTTISLVWLVICVVALLYSYKRIRVQIYGKMGLFVACCIVFLLGSKIIDLNVLSNATKEKLLEVSSICGDTYIKTSGNTILVNVKGKWLNLNKIEIIGGILTDDVTIEYDGETIYLGHSGVVNTIKALESVGLIDSK